MQLTFPFDKLYKSKLLKTLGDWSNFIAPVIKQVLSVATPLIYEDIEFNQDLPSIPIDICLGRTDQPEFNFVKQIDKSGPWGKLGFPIVYAWEF